MSPFALSGLLAGKVAVVTGGAFGIGRATAQVLADAGASVVIGDLLEHKAALVANDIVASGGQALAASLDVRDEGSIASLFETAEAAFGRVDLLDNNAAMSSFTTDLGALDVDLKTFDEVLTANLRGALLCARAAIPLMERGGGGAIVNITSGSASIGELTRVAYGTSKAGIEQLTRHLANRYGSHGIRTNAVAPGFIATESAMRGVSSDLRDRLERQNPLRRLGTPVDIAHVVAFLLSDLASYINGQVIHVDGGTQIAGVLAAPSAP